jgi:phenylpyruvate tautomerase PptA (4-oxalocrotonate tautomerase family)
MPLVRLTLAEGTSAETRLAIGDSIHRALVEVANAPADDRFQIIEQRPAEDLVFTPSYLGIRHTGPMVFVQITMNAGRSVEVKQALFARIAEGVAAFGYRKEDVIVSLVEVAKESWSFGGGVMSYPPPRS